MEEIIKFGDLEVGMKFEDSKGNKWMKTEEVSWLGSDTRRYFRNAVVLESAYPENPHWGTKPGQLGDFHPNVRLQVVSPNVEQS